MFCSFVCFRFFTFFFFCCWLKKQPVEQRMIKFGWCSKYSHAVCLIRVNLTIAGLSIFFSDNIAWKYVYYNQCLLEPDNLSPMHVSTKMMLRDTSLNTYYIFSLLIKLHHLFGLIFYLLLSTIKDSPRLRFHPNTNIRNIL